MSNIKPTAGQQPTAAEMLAQRLSDLGINALVATETIVLIELGDRGFEIFLELTDGTEAADIECPPDWVPWLRADVRLPEDADELAERFAVLLGRYPELRKNLQ